MTTTAPTKYEHKLWPEYVDFCFEWDMMNKHRTMADEKEREAPDFEEWLKMREKRDT